MEDPTVRHPEHSPPPGTAQSPSESDTAPGWQPDDARQRDQAARGPAGATGGTTVSNVAIALLLIGLGVALLLTNVFESGVWLFLALGAAFTIARVITNQYGFAVPAGLLLGFGSFVLLEESGQFFGSDGPWFFLLLGLGFLAVYIIGARWDLYWPLFPAIGLALFAALVAVFSSDFSASQWTWVAVYWPVALIALGAWLLIRQVLPRTLLTPVDVLIVLALVALSVLIVVVYTVPGVLGLGPVGSAPGALPGDPIELRAPIQPGRTLFVTNTSGDTRVTVGGEGNVRVTARVAGGLGRRAPEPRLEADDRGLRLTAESPSGFGFGGQADYEIEVPPGTALELSTASGDVVLEGLAQPVRVTTASGDIAFRLPAGPADATLQTASGDVAVWLDPATSAALDVRTTSGDISVDGLPIQGLRQDRRSLNGELGSGGRLTISTASGDIRLRGG